MNLFLQLAYLFFLGSLFGWVLELVFRKFFSGANPEHKWINPGFCVGPYVPLYGTGLCVLYLLSMMGSATGLDGSPAGMAGLLLLMAVSMTVIEYIAGILLLKLMHLRLWDYSTQWGNVQGLICPLFSLFWGILGAAYYFFVNPYTLQALRWLQENLAFSFVIGYFFGVFTIDLVYSAQLVSKLKAFAEENDVVIRYENLKGGYYCTDCLRELSTVHLLRQYIKQDLDSFAVWLHERRARYEADEQDAKDRQHL